MLKKIIPFCLTIAFVLNISAQEKTTNAIEGDWKGTLDAMGAKLRLVFHISKADDVYKVSMDSPDQGVKDFPLQQISYANDTLKIAHPAMMMTYTGILKADKIEGDYAQGGMTFPMNLERGTVELKRPQTPKKPYPYNEEEVSILNHKDQVILAGTYTTPRDKKDFPVAILISGSGPQDRDETLFEHRPFLVLADHLTKNGIAVLRYDDRGIAQSTGDFAKATSYDFANDVKAIISFLKVTKDIPSNKIYLVGHSEGGMIAPIVNASEKNLGGLVLMAAPGVAIEQLFVKQQYDLYSKSGMPISAVDSITKNNKGFYEILNSVEKSEIELAFRTYGKSIKMSDIEIEEQLQVANDAWFYNFITFNPQAYLQKVNVPVLAINGGKDLQVDADMNLAGIENALKISGNKAYEIKKYDNLNHLFQEAETGLPQEYGKIEETLSPEVLHKIANWINERHSKK
ncbi:S9 family peptidase [Mesonia sp. K7]|uniref:alpha/beta hydrolase family protein n=1 Tax=Mesonia sp. K7 TaxID=2218606 RepID=UPI000DA7B3EC|nr:alpha/beta hydrolase [Mesonia sp. K7]PZD77599.1 alpha/beta hydrolase [Mesonia sp. K7]